MKKLLYGTAAICGLAVVSSPAQADLQLDLGGYMKGYVAYVDQDLRPAVTTGAGVDEAADDRSVDIIRETEVNLSGEYTLDNGLTVGMHIEADADGDDGFNVDESYAYFSGGWGRINFGDEDGASYLLQVAAPSADSNIDGVRQHIQPVNYDIVPGTEVTGVVDPTVGPAFTTNTIGILTNGALAAATNSSFGPDGANGGGDDVVYNLVGGAAGSTFGNNLRTAFDLFVFDYDDDVTVNSEKVTYLSPVLNGFQLGLTWTPENDGDSRDATEGQHEDGQVGDYGTTYEIAGRYEGEFNGVGVTVGAGYTESLVERTQVLFFQDTDNDNAFTQGTDIVVSSLGDRESWNTGVDLDFGAIGVGVAYHEDDLGLDGGPFEGDRETWVIGADYTTGPFKLGASFYTQDQALGAFYGSGAGEMETDRYTGGVVYTYGPGMTFRGSISHIDHEFPSINGTNNSDFDATSVLLGTNISF